MIEDPKVREEAGKPRGGTVTLTAASEGNMIVIEVRDDRRGIDVEAVKARAIERELIHPSKDVTDEEAFKLIFDPGFSTAEQVTNISGRGVGLDVVRRQLEKLNGTFTVASMLGEETIVRIRLQLTLAIGSGLLVRVGEELYAVPVAGVLESLRLRADAIRTIDGHEVINVRDDVVSFLLLHRLFRLPSSMVDDPYVVVTGTGERRIGLVVDSLIGEEDVVIKPLNDRFSESPGVAGAAILGDGTVTLIIGVSELLAMAVRGAGVHWRRSSPTI